MEAATGFAADARRQLADRGLIALSSSGYVAFDAGGAGFARVLAANARQVQAALIDSGVPRADLERYLTLLDDPTSVFGSPVLINTCGRRPA